MGPIPLYWWQPPEEVMMGSTDPAIGQRNFGDELSPVIVSWLSNRTVEHTLTSPKFMAVGSTFFYAKTGDLVWGSGVVSDDPRNVPEAKELDVRAVRGPHSRKMLLDNGFSCPEIYGDPSLLLPMMYPAKATGERDWAFVAHLDDIPHYPHLRGRIIDVRWPWKRVVDEILKCKWIISSSLHGIIIAEIYGIPATWLRSKTNLHYLKFHDYYISTGRKPPKRAEDIEEAMQHRYSAPPPVYDPQALISAFPFLPEDAKIPTKKPETT